MVRSSVEIDGTGEEDMNCCIRLKAAAWDVLFIFHAPERSWSWFFRFRISEGNFLEGADLVGKRGFDWQPLHRAGAVKAVNSGNGLEDVGSILGRRDRSAVTQNDHILAHPARSLRPFIDEFGAVFERQAVSAPMLPPVVRPRWATMMSAPALVIDAASSALKT